MSGGALPPSPPLAANKERERLTLMAHWVSGGGGGGGEVRDRGSAENSTVSDTLFGTILY